jgi:trans-aconitate methyltransferase
LNKRFDQILSFFVFHWIKDKKAVFNCIKKALKKKGVMHIVAVHPENSMSSAFDSLKGDVKWLEALENRDKIFHANTETEYKQLLEDLGFKDIKVNVINVRYSYKDINSFVDYIMTWLPFGVGLEKARCLELAKILAKDVYNQLKIPTTGSLERPVPYIYVQATIF